MKERYVVEVGKGSVHTLQECADYLRCGYQTIYRLVREGKLKHFRVGAHYRVSGETLIKLTGGKA